MTDDNWLQDLKVEFPGGVRREGKRYIGIDINSYGDGVEYLLDDSGKAVSRGFKSIDATARNRLSGTQYAIGLLGFESTWALRKDGSDDGDPRYGRFGHKSEGMGNYDISEILREVFRRYRKGIRKIGYQSYGGYDDKDVGDGVRDRYLGLDVINGLPGMCLLDTTGENITDWFREIIAYGDVFVGHDRISDGEREDRDELIRSDGITLAVHNEIRSAGNERFIAEDRKPCKHTISVVIDKDGNIISKKYLFIRVSKAIPETDLDLIKGERFVGVRSSKRLTSKHHIDKVDILDNDCNVLGKTTEETCY